MSIKSVQSPAFKAYVPVTYYIKDNETGEYDRVTRPEIMKKCQSFVIRNLNGTAKNMACDRFVNGYSKYDSDYRNDKRATSYYDNENARVLMVTGKDVDAVKQMAKPIGIAKGEAIDRTGKSKSFESRMATRDYFKQLKSFLRTSCRQVHNQNGENLALRVYFIPKYKRDGSISKLNYDCALFTKNADSSQRV